MLRILVISLFVANLLLLGFQGSEPAAKIEPEVVRSATRDAGIPTIHLFSEMIEDQGLMSGSRRCFTLGPFHSSEDRDEVRLLLQEVSTRTGERRTEALVEKGYWVFMPPYASLLEANEELLSLQALGLEDIGIIYDGDWRNAISLGYFLRQENALRRKKALQERGYEPLMRVQRQTEPRFWLDYEQRPGSALVSLDMTNRPNDFLQRSVPCPEQDVVEAVLEAPQTEPQAAVEVVAQRQEPEAEGATAGDQGEVSTAPETLENARQEGVEEEPEQAVENVVEEVTEDSQDTPTVVEQTEVSEETPSAVGQAEDSKDTPPAVGQAEDSEDTPPAVGQAEDSEDTPPAVGQAEDGEDTPSGVGQAEDSEGTPSGVEQETGPDLGSEDELEENLEDKPAQPVGTGPADSVEEEPKQQETPEADDAEGSGTSEG